MINQARFWAALAMLSFGTLQGCTPRQLFVLDAAPAHFTDSARGTTSVALVEVEPAVRVDDHLRTGFRVALEKAVAAEPGLRVEDLAPLLLEYRFIYLAKGDVPVRVISGIAGLFGSPFYGLGDGSVGVEVRFRQRGGEDAGRIVVGSPIAGIFGSASEANKIAAEDIALYLKTNYTALLPVEGAEESPLAEGDEDPAPDHG